VRGVLAERPLRPQAAAIASGGGHHSQRNIAALRLEVERLGIEPFVDATLAAELDGYKNYSCLDEEIEVATCERLGLAAHCVVARAAAVIGIEAADVEKLMRGLDATARAVIRAALPAAASPEC